MRDSEKDRGSHQSQNEISVGEGNDGNITQVVNHRAECKDSERQTGLNTTWEMEVFRWITKSLSTTIIGRVFDQLFKPAVGVGALALISYINWLYNNTSNQAFPDLGTNGPIIFFVVGLAAIVILYNVGEDL